MKYEWLQYGLKELKFVKSRKDLRILFAKAAYLLPRAIGTLHRYTRVPYCLQVEPTNYCNVDCICCSRSASSRERGYMDFALFKKIVDDASKIGVKMVRLYALGEPMLHRRIIDMITYAKQKGLRIRLVTNGMLLDSERIEAILRSGIDSGDRIIFSVLGYSKEVHERIMKGVDHTQVVNNIRNFLELRARHGQNGPVVETAFLTMLENKKEKSQFYRYWRPVVDHVRIDDISKQFAEFKSGASSDRHRPLHTLPVRETTCDYLWDRMLVFWNGDVTVCIADLDGTYHLGNLRERSVSELWNSEALMSLRKMHREKRFRELPLCSSCDW